jgi:hypothetical protein
MASDLTDEEIVTQVVQSLHAKFPDTSELVIETIVRQELADIADRPVRDFLSVLTERAAKQRLKGK